MKCPKCGTENPNDVKSCWFCSSPLPGTTTTAPPQQPKTSGLAIASLVLGILSPLTCFLTAIPAIVLGIIALVKVSKSAGRLKGNGLAITGIVIPPVLLPVITIIAMVTAIMMPALARTKTIAFRMVCGQNLSALGKAMHIYANDNNNMFPTPAKWCDLLVEYQNVPKQTFACTAALIQHRSVDQCNFAMNKNVEKLGENVPPNIVLLFESGPGWNQAGGPEILTTDNHQGTGCNVLFVDGHVEFIKTEYLSNLNWDAKENQIQPPQPIQLPPP